MENLSISEWVSEWVVDWLIDWLIDWLSDWLIEWVIEWVIDWVIDWLIDWVIEWVIFSPFWILLKHLLILIISCYDFVEMIDSLSGAAGFEDSSNVRRGLQLKVMACENHVQWNLQVRRWGEGCRILKMRYDATHSRAFWLMSLFCS